MVNSGEVFALRKRLYIHEPCTVENAGHSLYSILLVNFTLSLSSNSCTDESATDRDNPQIRIFRDF